MTDTEFMEAELAIRSAIAEFMDACEAQGLDFQSRDAGPNV